MAISQSRLLLEQHNQIRLGLASLLQRVRQVNEEATGIARPVWLSGETSDALDALGHVFEEKLVELFRINEQAQSKALDAIRALKS